MSVIAWLLLSCTALPVDAPVAVDERHQLFLDDYLIASSENVQRRMHPVEKDPRNPVLRPTKPWEGDLTIVYGSVLREEGKFRMWYYASGNVAYAESEDGITWTKPELGVVEIEGRNTNVVVRRSAKEGEPGGIPHFYELFGVHCDDRDPDPDRRYKMGFLSIAPKYRGPHEDPFHRGQRRGLGVAASPDGIHWKLVNSFATDAICDGDTHWMFDPAWERYVLYGRTKYVAPEVAKAWGGSEWVREHYWGRSVARVGSPDFLKWSITEPARAPVVMTADLDDPPGTEIYSLLVFPYGATYIGLVQVFHNQPDTCYLDVQLATSRDTIHFTRVGRRRPFIPVGPVGSWDRFNQSLANNPPILVGDKLYFYYGGRSSRHPPYSGDDPGEAFSGIGLATIPRDRFVSLEASFNGGTILTKPLLLKGTTLHLNAKCDFGRILVEAVDAEGKVIARSQPFRHDSLDIPVRWQTGKLPGQDTPVRLRIHLTNALLYSFWCT